MLTSWQSIASAKANFFKRDQAKENRVSSPRPFPPFDRRASANMFLCRRVSLGYLPNKASSSMDGSGFVLPCTCCVMNSLTACEINQLTVRSE